MTAPRHLAPALALELGERVVQQPQAGVQGVPEARLLVLDDVGDEGRRLGELRVGGLHDVEHHPGGLVQERPAEADVAAVADGAAHDAPQHVAPALVGRQDPVADEKGRRAGMVGDDLHGDVGGRVLPELPAGQLLGAGDDGPDQVGVVIGGDVLDDRDDPLEPHAGVDAR